MTVLYITILRIKKIDIYKVIEMAISDHHLQIYLMEVEYLREKEIEQKLVSAVKMMGGICPKFTSPGFDGMPDRLVLLPKRKFGFVEVKAPGEKPRPLQIARHKLLRKLGFQIYVLDDIEQIGGILSEIQSS